MGCTKTGMKTELAYHIACQPLHECEFITQNNKELKIFSKKNTLPTKLLQKEIKQHYINYFPPFCDQMPYRNS